MSRKTILGILIALVMLVSGVCAVSPAQSASAAVYGTTLFQSNVGNVDVASSAKDGVQIEFGSASGKVSGVKYAYTADAEEFGLTWQFDEFHAKTLYITLQETQNSTRYLKLEISEQGEGLKAVLKDNFEKESSETTINAKITDRLTFTYTASGAIALNGTELDKTNLQTLTFYRNEVTVLFGVEGQESTVSSVKMLSMKNKAGEQTFVLTDEYTKVPTLLKYKEGLEEGLSTYSLKAAYDKSFVFPVYGINLLGTGLNVKVKEPGAAEYGAVYTTKTQHTLTKLGEYSFKLYTTDEENAIVLNVTSVEDKTAPTFDQALLQNAVAALKEQYNVAAPSKGNTYRFPDVRNAIVADAEGIDTAYNTTISIGYKRPGATGGYSFASGLDVTLDEVGVWTFEYRITDAAGNKTESKDLGVEWKLNIIDVDGPTITSEKEIEVTVNKSYTFGQASVSDNASGVDETENRFRVYRYDAAGDVDVTEELAKDDYVIQPTEVTPDDAPYSYKIVYTVKDKAGNVSTQESYLKVVKESSTDPVVNPANQVLKVVLIVLACLCGAGIVILLLIRPKDEKKKA